MTAAPDRARSESRAARRSAKILHGLSYWLLVQIAVAAPSVAATFTVNTVLVDNTDINPGDGKCEWATFVADRCTLRAAVHEANALAGADIIRIPNGWTIALSRTGQGEDLNVLGDLDIRESLTIQTVAPGGSKAVVDAGKIDRVFDVHSPARLTIVNLEISGGLGAGAGVNVRSPVARVDLSDCRLVGNEGITGVALNNLGGASTITRCTVEGNRNLTTADSSVLHQSGSGSLEIVASTIVANPSVHNAVDHAGSLLTIRNSTIASGYFIGIRSTDDLVLRNVTIYGHPHRGLSHFQPGAFSSPAIYNSIIAGNGFSSVGGEDCAIGTSGGITNIDHPNLDSDGSCGFLPAFGGLPNTDPMLGTLVFNGGPTQTMVPRVAAGVQSPVIDAGDNAACEAADQRGATRPLDGDVFVFDLSADCDLGAVEVLPCNTADPTAIVENVALGNGSTVGCFEVVAGPMVEIQAGATHLFRARDSVTIKSGFEVRAGATFSVELVPTAGSSVALP